MARKMQRTKLLVASAAILSCPVDGFSPMVGRPALQSRVVVPTATELAGKKKKNKNKKKGNGGKGRGGTVSFINEKPKQAVVDVEEKAPPEPVVLEDPKDGSLPLPEKTMEANFENVVVEPFKELDTEVFQRQLLAQKLAYDAQVVAEGACIEPFEEPDTESFQRQLLAQKLLFDAKVAFVGPDTEPFQRQLLAQKLAYDANVVAEGACIEPFEKPDTESFQRELLSQKLTYDAKVAFEGPDTEPFQRQLLAQKLAYDANVVAEGACIEPFKEPDTEPFQRQLLAQQLAYDAKVAFEGPDTEPFQRQLLAQKLVYDANEVQPDGGAFDQSKQPLSPEDETRVAAKYAGIADVGKRAFEILSDLGFFNRKN